MDASGFSQEGTEETEGALVVDCGRVIHQVLGDHFSSVFSVSSCSDQLAEDSTFSAQRLLCFLLFSSLKACFTPITGFHSLGGL